MSIIKRSIIIAAIIAVVGLNILVYWNQHLYYKAERIGDLEQRVEVLEKAIKYYPLNDLVFYELGKAYHSLGINSLGEEGRSSVHLQKSTGYFKRSLRINPTSYFGHFYLGQALYNMSFDSPSQEESALEFYKNAANLAGENSEVFFEVGKILLSRWPQLSEQDRDFSIEIMKEFLEKGEKERLPAVLDLWLFNVENYDVMERILPESALIYKDYARFLGEKSLSLEERLKFLVKAEFLEFQRARAAFEEGEYALFYYRPQEAENHFRSCLNILEGIRFYQDFISSTDRIDQTEFDRLQKRALLNQVKSLLDQGKDFVDVEATLWQYLAKEENASAIGELETYLKDKKLVVESAASTFNDLGKLAFRLYFSLKRGSFRENMGIGRNLLKSFVIVPEGKEGQFVKILEIVGESFQRVDFIYDSNDFYDKALEMDPDNLGILVKLRGNYERLRGLNEILAINRRIGEIVSPPGIDVNRSINKAQIFQRSIILDGREINLDLRFRRGQGDRQPLISVFFNGRVAWEDYLDGNVIPVSVEPKVGENVLQVVPVNRGVELVRIFYRGEESEK